MAKGNTPPTHRAVAPNRTKRQARTAPTSETSLLMVRMKELDREFARQTKQLTALTKKFGKKIADISTDKPSQTK